MSSGDLEDLFGTMIKVENKDLFVDLRQNSSGIYLKLSERNGTSRNTVLIPASGISRLRAVLEEVQVISLKNTRISHERKSRVAGDPSVVNRSVYVSGLAWATTDAGLKAHFMKIAPVKGAVVLRRNRGGKSVSLGCGVVEFGSPEIAQKAVHALNDTELDGRTIKCREDRTVEESTSNAVATATTATFNRPAYVGRTGGSSSGQVMSHSSASPAENQVRTNAPRVLDSNKVFVTSLSWETTSEDLIQLCSSIGEVVSAEVLMTKKGRSLGHGVVHFADAECAIEAVERLNRKNLDGREITVREFYMA
jgi:RNA recognition motif-containing protein